MFITIYDPDDVAIEIDTVRYRYDTDYRGGIHDQMHLAHDHPPFNWELLCAPEEELRAMGMPVFDSADFASEEAAIAALGEFLAEIMEEIASDLENEGRPRTTNA